MEKCIICSKDSTNHKYCYACESKRANACSVINQNVKRLCKLFKSKWYNVDGFWKFDRYVKNIQRQEAILMEFLEKDMRRKFGI